MIAKPIIDYSLNDSGALSDRDYIAIIGNDIWRRFNMTLDRTLTDSERNAILYLNPNKYFAQTDEFPILGMNFVDRSKTLGVWIVNCIYENSIAEKAGLQLGDKILKWNGRDISSIDIFEQQGIIKKTPYNILIERGTEHKLIIMKSSKTE